MAAIDSILPDYLRPKTEKQQQPSPGNPEMPSPDSTSNVVTLVSPLPARHPALSQGSPEPDLQCREVLSSESILLAEDEDDSLGFCMASSTTKDGAPSPTASSVSSTSSSSSRRSASPLSAVDIFTDFNTNVLRAYDEDPVLVS